METIAPPALWTTMVVVLPLLGLVFLLLMVLTVVGWLKRRQRGGELKRTIRNLRARGGKAGVCARCNGTGQIGPWKMCPQCHGLGYWHDLSDKELFED